MRELLVIATLALCCCGLVQGSVSKIVNGVTWHDTNGIKIDAHGGGWLLVGSTYYWYGENDKSLQATQHAVNCYSSTDLYNWKFEGAVFHQSSVTNVSAPGPYIVERPKVLYNKKTAQYVMWFHLDNGNYALRSVGIAVSKTPNGAFKWVRGFKPNGLGSLDQTVYQDDDGLAYHIRSVENQYVGITLLSDDYLDVSGPILSSIPVPREGPAMFKHLGNYYLVTSHLTGWAPNAMELWATGSKLAGAKWTSLGNPTGDSTSFNTQSTNVLVYKNMLIYQGDRWNYNGPGGLANATYVWLPIVPTGNSFVIKYEDSWSLPTW